MLYLLRKNVKGGFRAARRGKTRKNEVYAKVTINVRKTFKSTRFFVNIKDDCR